MLDATPPYILFEDNGDDTMKLTLHMGEMEGPEGVNWPQTFIFPMGFETLSTSFFPQDIQTEVQREFEEKVVHIPTGIDSDA